MPDPETMEISWFNPDPRTIIPINGFHTSKSLQKKIRSGRYRFKINTSFELVMKNCANREQTWINDKMLAAYCNLHQLGFAHSGEIWIDGELEGGVYGISIGKAFFAESKFHKKTDASKLALFHLIETLQTMKFQLFEVQFMTEHLRTLGAIEIPNDGYLDLLNNAISKKPLKASFLTNN